MGLSTRELGIIADMLLGWELHVNAACTTRSGAVLEGRAVFYLMTILAYTDWER